MLGALPRNQGLIIFVRRRAGGIFLFGHEVSCYRTRHRLPFRVFLAVDMVMDDQSGGEPDLYAACEESNGSVTNRSGSERWPHWKREIVSAVGFGPLMLTGFFSTTIRWLRVRVNLSCLMKIQPDTVED